MACFLVPMGEAIVTTVVQRVLERKAGLSDGRNADKVRLAWGRRLRLLNKMLWGGSVLLAFEHVWHGEVVPWPPFLTAMQNPADVAPMLHEIAAVGTAMAIATTIVWGIAIAIAEQKGKVTRTDVTLPEMRRAE